MDSNIVISVLKETSQYLIIKIKDSIDEPNAKDIWNEVNCKCDGFDKNVLFDLSELYFLAAGGSSLGGFLELRYKLLDNDKLIILSGLHDNIKEIFSFSGLNLLFSFSNDYDTAIKNVEDTNYINQENIKVNIFKEIRKKRKNGIFGE